ncbi:hypothetical protein Tco_0886909 [Tanacetum coccineum]
MMRLSVRRTRDEMVYAFETLPNQKAKCEEDKWERPNRGLLDVKLGWEIYFKALNEIKASLGWRVVVRELEMIRVEMVTYQLGLASHALHKVITESFLNCSW